jgi:hypothetical protein
VAAVASSVTEATHAAAGVYDGGGDQRLSAMVGATARDVAERTGEELRP